MGAAYKSMCNVHNSVDWYDIIAGNNGRPWVVTCLWLACHRRIINKDRLAKWGQITYVKCCLCNEVENLKHLFLSVLG